MKKRFVVVGLAAAFVGGLATGPQWAGGTVDDNAGVSAKVDGPLYGVLTGRKEIGPDGRSGAGDPEGRGSASAIIDEGQLCFGLTAKNIGEPTAAHIHRGNRSTNGPIVITLNAPAEGDPGASSGCVDVDSALARAILRNPHKYYWNIHTEEFPGGAVRGQVFERTR